MGTSGPTISRTACNRFPSTSSSTTDAADDARIDAVRGWVLRDLGRYAESEAALRRSLERARSSPGDMNPAVLRALNNLAFTLQLAGRKQESIATYESLIDWFAAHEPAAVSPTASIPYSLVKEHRLIVVQTSRLLNLTAGKTAPHAVVRPTGSPILYQTKAYVSTKKFRVCANVPASQGLALAFSFAASWHFLSGRSIAQMNLPERVARTAR